MTEADRILETTLQADQEVNPDNEADQKISESLKKMRQTKKCSAELNDIELLSPFEPVTKALKKLEIEGKWDLCDFDTCQQNEPVEQGIFKVSVPASWLIITNKDNCALYKCFNIPTEEDQKKANFPEPVDRNIRLIMIIPTDQPTLVYEVKEYNGLIREYLHNWNSDYHNHLG